MQTTGFTGKNFQATSNLRNETMLKEVNEFARHVKQCNAAIAAVLTSCDNLLTTTKNTMSVPLPRVFEETAAGAGGNLGEITKVAPDFSPEPFVKIGQDVHAKIESDVLVPVKRWLDVHATMASRIKEVEAIRLEVDSRRHTVIDLTNQIEKLRAKIAAGPDGKAEANLDEAVKTLQHKEGKLALTVQSFQEKEQALHADLTSLIKDAVWLRHYLWIDLLAQGEALVESSKALGDSTAPAASLMIASIDLGKQDNPLTPPTLGASPAPTP